MEQSPFQPILKLTRGDVVESVHYGAVAVVNIHNQLVAWWGNPQTVTFLRSSAKPFQIMPFLENGGQEAFQLTLQEIALLCASHSGTDEHKAVIEGIQAKTGVQESDLLCGTHPIFHRPTAEVMLARGEQPTPNRHNCSGKHTGMLAYARLLGLPYRLTDQPYIDPKHPIQQQIIYNFASMCGLDPKDVQIGIDGCSAPNFAVPLQNAAFGLAQLSDPAMLPAKKARICHTITKAMISHPNMVAGPGSFDTNLMEILGGKVISKGGAEGYQALGIMPGGIEPGSPALGVAIKISDGDLGSHTGGNINARGYARPAISLEVLRQLGAITDEELAKLTEFGPSFPLSNFRNIQVGHGYPDFVLYRENYTAK